MFPSLTAAFVLSFTTLSCSQTPLTYIPPVYHDASVSVGHFYEHTVPVIFKFKISNLDGNLISTGIGECSSADVNTHPWCPIHFHMLEIRDVIRPLITVDSLKSPSEGTTTRLSLDNSCSKVQSHFTSSHLSADGLTNYIQNLEECSKGLLIIMPLNTSFDYDFALKYRAAHTDYMINYYQATPTPEQKTAITIENAGLITTGFLHTLATAQLWKEALGICKSYKIPRIILPEQSIESMLLEVERLIYNSNYNLVISKDKLSQCYNLPVADCVIGDNSNELIVRLLIPVISSEFELFELSPIPFHHKFENKSYICFNQEVESKPGIFVTDRSINRVFDLDCDNVNDILCFLGNLVPPWRKSCAQAMLNSDSELEVITRCQMTCEKISDFVTPVIQQVNSNVFFVSGSEVESIVIDCEGETGRRHDLPDVGALEIAIPCQCKIVTDDGRAYYPSSTTPCSGSAIIKPVAPYNFKQMFISSVIR